MGDIAINNARTVQDIDFITGTLSNGDLVKLAKIDLMKLISSFYPQIERLNYGLGGVNHVSSDTSEIAADQWVYAVGFSDGEVVTVSLETDANVIINVYRDDGYTIGIRFAASDSNRITKTITNLGGKKMLIFSQNGPIRKLMVERGYFASEWKPKV